MQNSQLRYNPTSFDIEYKRHYPDALIVQSIKDNECLEYYCRDAEKAVSLRNALIRLGYKTEVINL